MWSFADGPSRRGPSEKQDEMKIKLFPLSRKKLERKLHNADCVTCLSESRRCIKIEQDFQFPADGGIITHIKTLGNKKLVPLEDSESIRHLYKIGDQVITQTNCSKPRNPSIICLGNNQWEIPPCKGKTTLKMLSYQLLSQNSDQVGGKSFII